MFLLVVLFLYNSYNVFVSSQKTKNLEKKNAHKTLKEEAEPQDQRGLTVIQSWFKGGVLTWGEMVPSTSLLGTQCSVLEFI